MRTTTEQIIYEHPLNERTRALLRLEHLFRQTSHHIPLPGTWDSRAGIDGLLGMIGIFARADLKGELLKELDRQRDNLKQIRTHPGVDMQRLDSILDELDGISVELNGIGGQIGQQLRENEFLKSILQRSSIPGGDCAFDLPLYHYWLEKPHSERSGDLENWLDTLTPVRNAVDLLLSLIRGSATPTREQALGGFFQRSLNTQAPAQLIRVGLTNTFGAFAEISGGKHRFTVRFLEPSDTERPRQTSQDIDFLLTCCII
jgi:cell division protein ZapD